MKSFDLTQAPTTEELAMHAMRSFVGLCVTCNNAETCVFRKRRGSDAIYCETFDGYASANGHATTAGGTVVLMPASAAEQTQLKGLCVNCAERDTCMLPKPKGGVWHCEEYR